MANSADIDATIQRNLHRLSKPGVLTARPGYEISDHQLTGRRAIVATVHTKRPLAEIPRSEALPNNIGGIPIDVREASPYHRLRAIDPLAAAVSHAYRRPEETEPEWPLERELPSGELLSSARSETQKKLKAQKAAQPAAAKALAAHQNKIQLHYDPQGCPPLTLVDVTATVTTAVSPGGLTTLTKFLGATTASLIVGMYDFTSATILRDFKDVLAAPKTLQIVLDDPAPNDTRGQTDWQTVQDEGAEHKGVDLTANIHTFPNVHNKGFVIDGETANVSSQNFSPAGVSDNRDAGVILESKQIAQYFAPIFDADWRTSRPLTVRAGARQPGVKATRKPAAKKPKKSVAKKVRKTAV